MLHCHYCLDGTKSHYFGHVLLTQEEYLPLDEVLLPPPDVNLEDVYNFADI